MLEVVRLLNYLVPKSQTQCALIGAPDLEDGLLAVSEELLQRGRNVILFTAGRSLPPGFVDERIRIVQRRGPVAFWAFLRSRDVFTTHGVYGDLEGPRSQRLTYLWHGEATGKRVERYLGGPPKPTSVAVTAGTVTQAFRCAEFGLPPSRVPTLGAPRNDRMLRATHSADHPLRTDRSSSDCHLLWLPTYRTAQAGARRRADANRGYAGLPYNADELLTIDAWLREHDVAVSVKLHPFACDEYDLETKAILPLAEATLHEHGLTTYTAIGMFDGLITDVSSIWLDYLLLDKPIIFAFPDIEEYRQRRGFVLEPYEDWVCGPVATDVDGLLAQVKQVLTGEDPDAGRRARTRRLVHRHEDDGSSRRVVNFVLDFDPDHIDDHRFD